MLQKHQNVLARAPSTRDSTVWTGRALQAESSEWQWLVLRFCIRPLVEQIAPGHHGYPRAFGLILRSALEGQLGHQITNATARPFSILQIQLADLGGCLLLLSGALGLTEAIPSEPPSLARPDRRATVAEKGGGHPFGEPERAHVAATLRRASYSRCCTSTLHAMRASLLARAVASTLWCNR